MHSFLVVQILLECDLQGRIRSLWCMMDDCLGENQKHLTNLHVYFHQVWGQCLLHSAGKQFHFGTSGRIYRSFGHYRLDVEVERMPVYIEQYQHQMMSKMRHWMTSCKIFSTRDHHFGRFYIDISHFSCHHPSCTIDPEIFDEIIKIRLFWVSLVGFKIEEFLPSYQANLYYHHRKTV